VSWALEYYLDDVKARAVAIGISDISESEARQQIMDAGFGDCGIEFSIFQSPLAGAIFTRCHRVRLEPGSEILNGGGRTSGPANQALLGGSIGGSDDGSVSRRFALSVAHLFSEVGTVVVSAAVAA